ncbi:MAG: SH3 domain-containing protein [Pyrinomonadaceae bacterium]
MLSKFSVYFLLPTAFLLFFPFAANAQKHRSRIRPLLKKPFVNSPASKYRTPVPAVVIEEKLAVLRFEPSLIAIPMQRMRAGRSVSITGERQVEGVTFYRVQLPPDKSGWVQAQALASNARPGDDERLAKLIRVFDGFEQLELASIFLENFPKSTFRPAILLLVGDLAEEAAQEVSRAALRKLDANEMQASGAPVHSFYLNFNGLDRYRKVGINFVFNLNVKQFHYDGAVWLEILQKHSGDTEALEARKRLDSLALQMK